MLYSRFKIQCIESAEGLSKHFSLKVLNPVYILDVAIRLDQTLGKPGAWMVSSSRERQRMTVIARLARVEIQVSLNFCSWLFFNVKELAP